MSDSSKPSRLSDGTKPPAKTDAQRQAALRRRRAHEGRTQAVYWLTEEEKATVKALLAGQTSEDVARLVAERDALVSQMENSRSLIRQQQDQLADLRDALHDATETLKDLRQRLASAEQSLKEKPARSFKVSDLLERRKLIFSAMSQKKAWSGEPQELSVTNLKQQADLAKKFATEIRHARSRVASLVQITSGEKPLEQSKANASWGGWNMFRSPLTSPGEKALLQEACAVMGRLESDVERAGSDLDKLHKTREAEDEARRKAASAALDSALFKHLDRRGEVLFIAAVSGNRGWIGSGWNELLEGAKGDGPRWKSASESFRDALREAKGTAIERVADGMKKSGKSAAELANDVAEKYRHPDTREKLGELADRITAFLVSEQFAGKK